MKKLVDYVSLDKYVDELKQFFHEWIKERAIQNAKNFEETVGEFKKVIKYFSEYNDSIQKLPEEDLIKYAERVAKNGKKDYNIMYQELLSVKSFVESIWLISLYRPNFIGRIKSVIQQILEDQNRRALMLVQ